MYSKFKFLGHPVHPMFVAFPISFYTAAFLSFVVFQFGSRDTFWYSVGITAAGAGVITALIAAVPGFVDWAFGIPRKTAAKKRGFLHASYNVVALILFTSLLYSWKGTSVTVNTDISSAVLLSGLGFLLTLAAGYEGWDLIARDKVGVELSPMQEKLQKDEESAEERKAA